MLSIEVTLIKKKYELKMSILFLLVSFMFNALFTFKIKSIYSI